MLFTVPATYLPCLRQFTTETATDHPTTSYRSYLAESLGSSVPCPPGADPNPLTRAVYLYITPDPIGLFTTDKDNAVAFSITAFTTIAFTMLSIQLTAWTIARHNPNSRPATVA